MMEKRWQADSVGTLGKIALIGFLMSSKKMGGARVGLGEYSPFVFHVPAHFLRANQKNAAVRTIAWCRATLREAPQGDLPFMAVAVATNF
jgi:hypothetical protein